MRKITIYNTLPGVRLPRKKLLELGAIVLKGERRRQDVNLIFVSDRTMKSINKEFRAKNKTTDVLSFQLGGNSERLLGEIYISPAEAARNAAEYGISISRELLKLFCHGLLHLCGIHHPNPRARSTMAAKEEAYLLKLSREVRK
jgi:probable rRNA maturation factor